ncbi:MAG: hypothetical protein HZB44_04615 [Actinobacteria bacterium]|nr:hypothetical protein [Actinomycetota bacterium]
MSLTLTKSFEIISPASDTSEIMENSEKSGKVIYLDKKERKNKEVKQWPEPATACSYDICPPEFDLIITCEPKTVHKVKGRITSIKRAMPPHVPSDIETEIE